MTQIRKYDKCLIAKWPGFGNKFRKVTRVPSHQRSWCCALTPGLREVAGRPGQVHFLFFPFPRTHVAMGPRILGRFATCFVCSWTFFQVSECGFTSLFLIAECYRCSLIYFTDFLWWTFRSIPISSKINNVVMNIIVLISFFDLFNSSHWIYQNQMWL